MDRLHGRGDIDHHRTEVEALTATDFTGVFRPPLVLGVLRRGLTFTGDLSLEFDERVALVCRTGTDERAEPEIVDVA